MIAFGNLKNIGHQFKVNITLINVYENHNYNETVRLFIQRN